MATKTRKGDERAAAAGETQRAERSVESYITGLRREIDDLFYTVKDLTDPKGGAFDPKSMFEVASRASSEALMCIHHCEDIVDELRTGIRGLRESAPRATAPAEREPESESGVHQAAPPVPEAPTESGVEETRDAQEALDDLFAAGGFSVKGLSPSHALAVNALAHAAREFEMLSYAITSEDRHEDVLRDHCFCVARQLMAAVAMSNKANPADAIGGAS